MSQKLSECCTCPRETLSGWKSNRRKQCFPAPARLSLRTHLANNTLLLSCRSAIGTTKQNSIFCLVYFGLVFVISLPVSALPRMSRPPPVLFPRVQLSEVFREQPPAIYQIDRQNAYRQQPRNSSMLCVCASTIMLNNVTATLLIYFIIRRNQLWVSVATPPAAYLYIGFSAVEGSVLVLAFNIILSFTPFDRVGRSRYRCSFLPLASYSRTGMLSFQYHLFNPVLCYSFQRLSFAALIHPLSISYT